jgi:hypothetical protein
MTVLANMLLTCCGEASARFFFFFSSGGIENAIALLDSSVEYLKDAPVCIPAHLHNGIR